MMIRCDVLIVGGGLAGCSAAYHLGRLGVDGVIVCERMSGKAFDGYHRTCGEAVSTRMAAASGLPDTCAVRTVSNIDLRCGNVDIDIPVDGMIIDRLALLSRMKQDSGAEFVKGSVTDVREADGGYIVTCSGQEYFCRYLIGADGAFSIVRKRLFGTGPDVRFAAVNNLVSGDSGDGALGFEVSERYPGAYRWDFPSKDGLRSIGYAVGTDDIQEYKERGIRFIVTVRQKDAVRGNCCLVGDAAMLINPVCYGGIGAALLSGRKAAECVAKGDLSAYRKWIRTDRMFDSHFMDAYETFMTWGPDEYADAVKPFRKGYSILRGAYAMMRRPRWANVYMSIWVAFRRGW